ncbi:methyltransferase [Saccharopolyspora shandongensis]|uniref:methyltransferase n=1 Tax=Saccharopolyspora shandongensis TaxID=418495 RepID=UPI0033C1278A
MVRNEDDGALVEPGPADFESRLGQILNGHWDFHVVGAVTRLGIADHLADGSRTAAELAAEIGSGSTRAVAGLLNVAESIGLVRRVGADLYGETPMLALLRRDGGASRTIALMVTAPGLSRPLEMLDRAVLSGRAHSEQTLGKRVWAYYEDNPDEEAWFADYMSELTEMVADSVLPRYEFPARGRIVDVGGSNGTFLARILAKYPAASGVIFDRRAVLDGARRSIAGQGLTDRVEFVAGDFRAEAPVGGDLYLLKSVMCDWDDESCVRILTRCREVAAPGVPVVVVDWLYREHPESVFDAIDLRQLATLDGKVRSLPQYESLFAAAGLQLRRVDSPTGPDAADEWAPTTVFETVPR